MTDLHALGIVDCARAMRAGELSAVELVTHLLARIERHDSTVNSFIRLMPEAALDEARRCDALAAQGRWLGPLHGIPYALKDIIDVAGLPTTCHSRLRSTHVATADASVVQALRQAGAVLIGKTALHEFATGGPSFDLPWPPVRNPWNLSVHPGGSSSGSAAAVCAQFVPFSIGTDTGGSVRHPASVCGVVGMKATYGAVDVAGSFPLSFSLDHIGPLARSVADIALALAAMLTPEARRRLAIESVDQPFGDLERGLAGLRVGVVEGFHAGADVDPEIVAATERAVEAIRRAGGQVRPVALSPLAVYIDCGRTILQAEAFSIHAGSLAEHPGMYGRRGRQRLLAGLVIDSTRYLRAQQVRTHLAREFADATRDLDCVVAASSLALPCAIDDEALVDRTYDRQARTPFNVLGAPAISVPIGLSASGLPIGLQVAAQPFREHAVLRAAAGVEAVLDTKSRLLPALQHVS